MTRRDLIFAHRQSSGMDTWASATQKWRTELIASGVSRGTIELRLSHLRRWQRVCPHPWSATRDSLLAFLSATHWAPEYRRSVRSTFRVFYGWAYKERLIGVNPADDLPKVRVPVSEPRPAPDDAIRQALKKADNRQALMLLLAAACGLRRAEVAAVHTGDLSDGLLRVKGKGGRTRVVAVPPNLGRMISACPDGWLFPNGAGSHYTSAHVGVLLRRILPCGVTPHMLRHAAASALHDQGLDYFELRRFLGHASISTTQRYVFIHDRRLQAATIAAAARLAS